MTFYNRTRELETLSYALNSGQGELLILYGRRGVGKSALLAHALTGRRHVYYAASRRTLPLQLAGLADMVRVAYPGRFVPEAFGSTDEFLAFLAGVAEEQPAEPVIAVLDELPFLAEADQGFLTVLQHWWDRNKRRSNLKLFLAGSYVSFMEREVLDVQAPLYNRRTGAMKLGALRYHEAALFLPGYDARRQIEAFAVFGGMPTYLAQVSAERSLDENLLMSVLRGGSYLNQEPEWILLEDLRKDVTYGSILRAIASGSRKPSDIARAIGKRSAQDITPHLATLRDLELVRREIPITDRRRPGSRNSLYWLADNYLAFWYRYVDPNQSLIADGHAERALARIKSTFAEYVSRPPFEEVCRQFLWRAYGSDRLPEDLEFNAIGSWWNASAEIDIVAQDGNRTTLVGSCKWTNTRIGLRDLTALQHTLAAGADALEPVDDLCFALFSREGFDEALTALAAQPTSRILLFSFDDLFA